MLKNMLLLTISKMPNLDSRRNSGKRICEPEDSMKWHSEASQPSIENMVATPVGRCVAMSTTNRFLECLGCVLTPVTLNKHSELFQCPILERLMQELVDTKRDAQKLRRSELWTNSGKTHYEGTSYTVMIKKKTTRSTTDICPSLTAFQIAVDYCSLSSKELLHVF
jgi:hypothetical protein